MQPDLFNDPAQVPSLAVFRSWPRAMQLRYLAHRDFDSGAAADSEWWTCFYLERGRRYAEDAVREEASWHATNLR